MWKELAERTGMTQAEVKKVINAFMAYVKEKTIDESKKVVLRGFGTFFNKHVHRKGVFMARSGQKAYEVNYHTVGFKASRAARK